MKARDFFPDEYVDYKICQIAMGRIKKGHVDGFLPLEYLDIAMPSGAIMNMLSGGEMGYEDTFEENYGEYFEDDDDDDDTDILDSIECAKGDNADDEEIDGNSNNPDTCWRRPGTPPPGIPEFPTVALPIAAVIGLVFFFQNRKKKEE